MAKSGFPQFPDGIAPCRRPSCRALQICRLHRLFHLSLRPPLPLVPSYQKTINNRPNLPFNLDSTHDPHSRRHCSTDMDYPYTMYVISYMHVIGHNKIIAFSTPVELIHLAAQSRPGDIHSHCLLNYVQILAYL